MYIPKKFRTKFDDESLSGYFFGYVNEQDGFKVWVPSKHRIMISPNVEFRSEKLSTTNNSVELGFHPPQDDRHDVNSQNAFEDEFHRTQDDDHISESDYDNDVNEEDTHLGDSNDFPLSRPVHKIKRPAKFKDYKVGYQPRRANIALAYLTQAVQQDLKPTNFDEAMQSHDSSEWFYAMCDVAICPVYYDRTVLRTRAALRGKYM